MKKAEWGVVALAGAACVLGLIGAADLAMVRSGKSRIEVAALTHPVQVSAPRVSFTEPVYVWTPPATKAAPVRPAAPTAEMLPRAAVVTPIEQPATAPTEAFDAERDLEERNLRAKYETLEPSDPTDPHHDGFGPNEPQAMPMAE